MTEGPQSSADESSETTAVRRLLADSRYTEPMPEDVASRMDRVLAELSGAAPAAPTEPFGARDAAVVPIAAHRRRRAAGLLVAAAAIVVGGIAVAQNLPSPGSSGPSTTSAAEGRSAQDDSLTPKASSSAPTEGSLRKVPQHGRVVVRPRHFTQDALQARRLLDREPSGAPAVDERCADLAGAAGAVPAEYRHARAALVFRRPEGASQVVDLYVCGTPHPVRSTTLPAP